MSSSRDSKTKSHSWLASIRRFFSKRSSAKPQVSTAVEKGTHLRNEGKLNEAIDYFETILKAKNGRIFDRLEAIYQLGLCNVQLREYEKAVGIFKDLENQAKDIQNEYYPAVALHQLGNIQYLQTNYSEALKLYQTSLELKKRIKDTEEIFKSLNNIAATHKATGEFNQALEHYEEALSLAKKNTQVINNKALGTLLGNIGVIYQEQGQPTKALDYYKRALDYQTDTRLKGTILFNTGNVYLDLGDLPTALGYYRESGKLWREINEFQSLTYIYLMRGRIGRILGNYSEATTILEEALDLAQNHKVFDLVAAIMLEQGTLAMNTNQLDAAEQIFLAAQQRQLDSGSTDHLIGLFCAHGLLNIEYLQRVEKALPLLDQAEQIALKHDSLLDLRHVELYRAIYYLKTKQLDHAQSLLDRILDTNPQSINFETRASAALRRAELNLDRHSREEKGKNWIGLALQDLNLVQNEIKLLSLVPLEIDVGLIEIMFLELQMEFSDAEKILDRLFVLAEHHALTSKMQQLEKRREMLQLQQKALQSYKLAEKNSAPPVSFSFLDQKSLSDDIRGYIKQASTLLLNYSEMKR